MSVSGFGPRSGGASRSFLLGARSTEHGASFAGHRTAFSIAFCHGLWVASYRSGVVEYLLRLRCDFPRLPSTPPWLDGLPHLARRQCSPGLVLGRTLKGPLADRRLDVGTLSRASLRNICQARIREDQGVQLARPASTGTPNSQMSSGWWTRTELTASATMAITTAFMFCPFGHQRCTERVFFSWAFRISFCEAYVCWRTRQIMTTV